LILFFLTRIIWITVWFRLRLDPNPDWRRSSCVIRLRSNNVQLVNSQKFKIFARVKLLALYIPDYPRYCGQWVGFSNRIYHKLNISKTNNELLIGFQFSLLMGDQSMMVGSSVNFHQWNNKSLQLIKSWPFQDWNSGIHPTSASPKALQPMFYWTRENCSLFEPNKFSTSLHPLKHIYELACFMNNQMDHRIVPNSHHCAIHNPPPKVN